MSWLLNAPPARLLIANRHERLSQKVAALDGRALFRIAHPRCPGTPHAHGRDKSACAQREQPSIRLDRYSPAAMAKLAVSNRRLNRMEALLLEMRSEQDVSLKHITRLQVQLDLLTESASSRENARPASRLLVIPSRMTLN